MPELDFTGVDRIPRPVVALSGRYGVDAVIPLHSHGRAQLLCALAGMAIVTAERNRWLILPDHALWIPSGVPHSVTVIEPLVTGSVYVADAALFERPAQAHLVRMSGLMRSLVEEAVKLDPEYDPDSRGGLIMGLILKEIPLLGRTPLSLPLPRDARLGALCRRYVAAPSAHETIDRWAAEMAMSRSAFTRAFRRETGLAVSEWRQQACLLAALPRLMSGEKVANVAFDLGYGSAAAFTTMFKRVLGVPPRTYLKVPAPAS